MIRFNVYAVSFTASTLVTANTLCLFVSFIVIEQE